MADVWSYNIQWLVGEDTGKSLNTHSFFLPTRNLYLCIAQKNGTVAESTKRPPDFSQRNNTSDSSRLLSVNLPALQIPISLPLICSSALSCWFLQWQAGTSCTHKPEICLPEASSYGWGQLSAPGWGGYHWSIWFGHNSRWTLWQCDICSNNS